MCIIANLFFGRVTQLVECHPYKVEVTGSSPVVPTTLNRFKSTFSGYHCFLARKKIPINTL